MKKRLLILLLAVAMVLCACGKRHEHAFSAEYTSDEEYHWFACECGEKDGYEKHVWNKGSVTLRPTTEKEGELTFTCTVCRATRIEKIDKLTSDHTHTYEFENSDESHHWNECVCGAKQGSAEHKWDAGTVTIPATEIVTGVKTFACIECGRKVAQMIPATTDNGLSFTAATYYKMSDKLAKNPLTVEAEIFLDPSVTGRAGAVFGNYLGVRQDFLLEIYQNGVPRLYYTDASGNIQDYKFTNVDVRTGDWVHIALTFDFENRTISLYMNGEIAQILTCNTDLASDITTYRFVVGGDNRSDNSNYFKGQIRSVAAYSDVRTAEEIARAAQNGTNIYADDLLVAFLLNKNSGENDIQDLSENGHVIEKEWLDSHEVSLDYAYSFAVVGDTQWMCLHTPEKMEGIYDWILANKDSKKISYVFGLGDITETWVKKDMTEWNLAKEYISKLDGVIPYSLVRGNHDETKYFNQMFSYPSYVNQLDGFFKEGDLTTAYRTFTVGSTDYLVVILDYGASDEALAWANDVVLAHPNHRVIVTTHGYQGFDGEHLTSNNTPSSGSIHAGSDIDANGSRSYNDGKQIWEKFVSKHPNIFLVMSGHTPMEDVFLLQTEGDHGNVVNQMLIDPQWMDASKGGVGMVCMLYFSADGSQMEVEWLSTETGKYYKEKNQFSIDLTDSLNAPAHKFQASYNETHHYMACDCGYTYDKAAHAFDGGVLNTDGFMVYSCDCGYKRLASATDDPVAISLQKLLNKYYNNGVYYKETVMNAGSAAIKVSFYQKDKFWIGNTGYGTSVDGKLTQFTVLENGTFGTETVQSEKQGMEEHFLTLYDFVLGSYKGAFTNGENLRLDLGWNALNGVYTSTNAGAIEGAKLLVALPETDGAAFDNLTKVTIEEANDRLVIKLWKNDTVAAQAVIGYYATTSFNALHGETLAVLYTKADEQGLCSITAPKLEGYVAEYDRYVLSIRHDALVNTIWCSKRSVWDGTAVSTGLSGQGTEADPFLIQSAADFAYLKTAGSSGRYFKLMTSIDLNGHAFTIDTFNGTLDGNHCSIRGMNITNTVDNTGLFKSLGVDSYIYDLSLYGKVSGQKYTGALAGATNGRVVNVVNFATVSGAGNLGGLIGNTKPESYLEGCINYGNVNGSSWNNGGVVGFAQNRVINCINHGTVTTTGDCAGGVVGTAHSKVIGCINYGVVNAQGRSGGVVYNSKSIVDSCINYGTVNGGWDLGGILGYVAKDCTATISNCVNNGKVSGTTGIGGVFGFSEPSAKVTITGCINNGEIIATWGGGGIAGNTYAEISGCVNNGKVSGNGELGGIVGKAYGRITGCINEGTVAGTTDIIGGIIGHLHNIAHLAEINTTNDNIGTVTGPNSKGLIGKADGVISANENIVGINHRGWYEAPENTLSAYRASAKQGFKYVECDVQFTKDGIPVLLHDDTIDRTSNGSGTISQMTYAELQQYDFSYDDNDTTVDFSAYRGEKIPTFTEFIALCKELNLHPYIEIKGTITTTQASELLRIVTDAGMVNHVSWLSFSGDALAKIAAACPTARIVWVITDVDAAKLKATHVPFAETNLMTGKNQVVFDLWYSLAKQDVVDLLKAHSILLEVWTVNDPGIILGLHPYVTGVTSDKYNAGQVVTDAKAGK